MKEMTVQDLLDYLLSLPLVYRSKKITMDPQAPVGNLTEIVALESEDALLFKGGDDNVLYRLAPGEADAEMFGG